MFDVLGILWTSRGYRDKASYRQHICKLSQQIRMRDEKIKQKQRNALQWETAGLKEMCFLFFQAWKMTEICLFPCYFVRGAFIKITNIDFGKAMKRVMTLRQSVVRACACLGRGWRSVNMQWDRTSLWILIISPSLQSLLFVEQTTSCCLSCTHRKNKIFCLLSGKDQSDISPSHTPHWKCLFQPPDIYIPALSPFHSILIFWSCQSFS